MGAALAGGAEVVMAEAVTREWLEKIFADVSNWGRWGKDDERGALNYLTPARRKAAAALVQDGEVVSLSLELAVASSPENPSPAHHHMLMAGDARTEFGVPGLETAMDYVGVAFHGMATTHLDALCHVFVRGQMYNGFPAGDVRSTGALRNSVMSAADGLVGRGVLLDIPRLRGIDWLEPGEAIHTAELEAAERAQGVRVEEGDILLVATGRDARRKALGPWNPQTTGLAGLHPDCIPWIHARRVAVLGSDGVSDPLGTPPVEGWPIPVHQCCLVSMGVHLLDNLELGRLSRACSARNRWVFLFSASPLRIARATGSPLNPLALF